MENIGTSTVSDENTVELIKNGELGLFSNLVDRYSHKLFNYLLRLLYFHNEDAQDALSETFLKAFTNINSFNSRLKFSSWIYRIAHNQAMDTLRKKKYNLVELDDNLAQSIAAPQKYNFFEKQDLEKVLQLLSIEDRNLLVLFYLEEKTTKEISDILKLRSQTVSVKIHRAKLRARENVSKYIK